MANKSAPTPKLDIVVQHHSSHESSPDQAEVLVSGLRVAYISYGPGHPISFLPPKYLKKRIPVDELEQIVAVARAEVAKLAQEQLDAQERIARLLAGDTE